MFFLVNARVNYARQQEERNKLETFLDKNADHTHLGTFNEDVPDFRGHYVLELNGELYILKKNVQANIDLINRSARRKVIERGKINMMKYKGNGGIYL